MSSNYQKSILPILILVFVAGWIAQSLPNQGKYFTACIEILDGDEKGNTEENKESKGFETEDEFLISTKQALNFTSGPKFRFLHSIGDIPENCQSVATPPPDQHFLFS